MKSWISEFSLKFQRISLKKNTAGSGLGVDEHTVTRPPLFSPNKRAHTANMSGGPLTLREMGPDNEDSPVPSSVVHLTHAKLRNERRLNYV